jgi:hypothetical protein
LPFSSHGWGKIPACVVAAYQRNEHPELTPELRYRIREVCRPLVAGGLFDPGEPL